MLRIWSNAALLLDRCIRSPWETQKRFMGGANKSMARARKNFAMKLKKESRARMLSRREVLPALDKELRKESRMRMLWNVKLILSTRTGRVIPSVEFTRLSRDLGFPRPRLFPQFIRQYPAVFRITNDQRDRSVSWLEFSEMAERLIEEEEKIMREYHEPLIVENLRKILMMAPERKLLLSKVALIRPSFWIPDDFRTSILPKYPEFFTISGGYLELTSYDRSLAVSSREKKQSRNDPGYRKTFEGNSRLLQAARNPNAFRITLEPHKVMEGIVAMRLISFLKLPFPGPYDPVDNLDSRTMEAHKRAVGVCHEFLSLTVEKRAFVEHLARLRRDLMLPEKLEDMLARFPHIFYICMKGDRHVVFLKEYYQRGQLIEKHPLSRIRMEFSKLMAFTTLPHRRVHAKFSGISAESFVPQPPLPQELVQAVFPEKNPASGVVQAAFPEKNPASGREFLAPAAAPAEFHQPGFHRFETPQVHRFEAPQVHRALEQGSGSRVPLEDQGVFLQLGFSSEEDEEKPRENVTSDPRQQQHQSLGKKLGILSDDDDSESEKPAEEDPWAGWRKPAPKDGEDVELVKRIKKRTKKPYWEKRPLDDFIDPFF